MHYDNVTTALLRGRDQGFEQIATFVSPLLSVIAAASTIENDPEFKLRIEGEARDYASNNGLIAALERKYRFPVRGGLQGKTYTKLTKLSNHDEVDGCNAIVNDLIQEHVEPLSDFLASKLMKVVGELHDNVASHARGAGFSCAQVYNSPSIGKRVEFAIADAGCGMLRNVQTCRPDITSHSSAIQWCIQRGNTSAKESDEWAQKFPDDGISGFFDPDMESFSVRDHHVGEGLWRFSELIRSVNGSLWIASGDAQLIMRNGQEGCQPCPIIWSGVAIEFEIQVQPGTGLTPQQKENLDKLAGRIGL